MTIKPKNHNTQKATTQKTNKKHLRIFPHGHILKKAPASPPANRRVCRQSEGGKVDITQPPHVSGFFVPANPTGDNTSLPGGYGIKKRLRVNTCGVSFGAPTDSRQFYDCQTCRLPKGITAMNNANTHGIDTPVSATPGEHPTPCNSCLLPSSVLTDVIHQAKAETAQCKCCTGSAYAQLLKHFHAAIFPVLITETRGNITHISRLLGIHRDSVNKYAESVGMKHLLGAGQGVKS